MADSTRITLLQRIRDQHDESSWEDFVVHYRPYIFAVLRNICTMNCGLRSRLHEVSPALQRNLDRIGIVRLRA